MSEYAGYILNIQLTVACARYVSAGDLIRVEIGQLADVALSERAVHDVCLAVAVNVALGAELYILSNVCICYGHGILACNVISLADGQSVLAGGHSG